MIVSWVFFLFTLEMGSFSELIWHAIVADAMYHVGAILLFSGLLYYLVTGTAIGATGWLLILPIGFYAAMLYYSPIRNALTIYRQDARV